MLRHTSLDDLDDDEHMVVNELMTIIAIGPLTCTTNVCLSASLVCHCASSARNLLSSPRFPCKSANLPPIDSGTSLVVIVGG
jgi:hypothetical protein